jgi:hypothetical protein
VGRIASLAPASAKQPLLAKLGQECIEEQVLGIAIDQTCAKLTQNRGVKAGIGEREGKQVLPVNPAANCLSDLCIGQPLSELQNYNERQASRVLARLAGMGEELLNVGIMEE